MTFFERFYQLVHQAVVYVEVYTETDAGREYQVLTSDDEALNAHAVTQGRTTWDATDICAVLKLTLPPVPEPLVLEPILFVPPAVQTADEQAAGTPL